MNRIARVILVLLSFSPIASVAAAAQAKASEMDGEAQSVRMRTAIQSARFRLIPTGETAISQSDAIERYSNLTGLQGEELEKRMREDINLLRYSGLLQADEKMLHSEGPSEKY